MRSKGGWRRRAARLAGAVFGVLALSLLASAWAMRDPFVLRPPRVPTTPADEALLRETVRVLAEDCVSRSCPHAESLERVADE